MCFDVRKVRGPDGSSVTDGGRQGRDLRCRGRCDPSTRRGGGRPARFPRRQHAQRDNFSYVTFSPPLLFRRGRKSSLYGVAGRSEKGGLVGRSIHAGVLDRRLRRRISPTGRPTLRYSCEQSVRGLSESLAEVFRLFIFASNQTFRGETGSGESFRARGSRPRVPTGMGTFPLRGESVYFRRPKDSKKEINNLSDVRENS